MVWFIYVNLDLHNLPKLITWLNNQVNLFVFKGSKNVQYGVEYESYGPSFTHNF